MTFGLEVTDDRLDRRSVSQFALDDAEYAALLAGDEDAAWITCIVYGVSHVDIAPFDLAGSKPEGGLDQAIDRAPRLAGAEVIDRRQLMPGVFNSYMMHKAQTAFSRASRCATDGPRTAQSIAVCVWTCVCPRSVIKAAKLLSRYSAFSIANPGARRSAR